MKKLLLLFGVATTIACGDPSSKKDDTSSDTTQKAIDSTIVAVASPAAGKHKVLACPGNNSVACSLDHAYHVCISELHERTESELNGMIKTHFGTNTVKFTKKTSQEMHDLIDKKDCDKYMILITGYDSHTGTLNIDTVEIPIMPPRAAGQMFDDALQDPNALYIDATKLKGVHAYYNIAMFLGIFSRYTINANDVFQFYKAVEASGKKTVVLKVYSDASGAFICGADLSGLP